MAGGSTRDEVEQRTGLIASMAPFPIGVTRLREGTLVYVNAAFAEFLGAEPEELLGRPAPDFYADPADRDTMLAKLREHGELRGYEIRAVRPDGSDRVVLVNLTLLELDGEPCVMATVLDITERVRIQRTLDDEQLRLKRMLDIAGDAIVSVDEKHEIVLYNRAAEEMFGYSVEEALGRPLELLIPAGHRAAHPKHMREFAGSKDSSRRMGLRPEVNGVRRDGTTFPLGVSISKLEQDDGYVYTAILRDLTAQKTVAAALEQSRAQLRQSQKMEALGRLAGGIAHDFNNLLTAIIGNSALILNGSFEASEVRREVEEIERAAERATELTQQLLAFGRKQAMRPRVVDLGEIVSHVQTMLGRLIAEHIELAVQPVEGPFPVEVDPSQMEQVLVNLVINAAHAMPSPGRLTIRASRRTLERERTLVHGVVPPGDWFTLTVEDTGEGMDDATLQRIFEPFFTTKPVGAGTGLGLSTVLGIINQSHGYIEVSSVLGSGSSFRVWLPAHAESALESENRPPLLDVTGGGEHVLLVEDNELVRSLTERLLTDMGYAVVPASGGDEALAIARERSEPIDLLLTDVVMPGLSGPELAARIVNVFPRAKVVFMTGYAGSQIESLGAELGNSRVLHKPFRMKELAATVRETLDEGGPERG